MSKLCQKVYRLQQKVEDLSKQPDDIEGLYIGKGYEFNNLNNKDFILDYDIQIKINKKLDNVYYIDTVYKNKEDLYNYSSTKYGILKEGNIMRLITEFGYHELEFKDSFLNFTYVVNKHPVFNNLVGKYHLKR